MQVTFALKIASVDRPIEITGIYFHHDLAVKRPMSLQ